MEVCTIDVPVEYKVVVVSFEETRDEAMRITAMLREHLIVDMDVMGRSFGAQLKYANTKGAKWAIIAGEDEISQGKVSLKNMETGNQELVNIDELVQKIK